MKHAKASARQRICYSIFCAALYSWCAANNFASCLHWKSKFWNSSSAEEASAADDVSTVNVFVTVLFTLGCVYVELPFRRLVNLKVLFQANLHATSLQGPRSTIPDTRTQYLVLGGGGFQTFTNVRDIHVFPTISPHTERKRELERKPRIRERRKRYEWRQLLPSQRPWKCCRKAYGSHFVGARHILHIGGDRGYVAEPDSGNWLQRIDIATPHIERQLKVYHAGTMWSDWRRSRH